MACSKDDKKQNASTEQVHAAQQMKVLTSKYGSKGKTPKQYFFETYDEDFRLEDQDDTRVHHYDASGREIQIHLKTKEKTTSESDSEEIQERPVSPIVFSTPGDLAGSDGDGNTLRETASEGTLVSNFWEPLEKDNVQQSTSSFLSLCPTDSKIPLVSQQSLLDRHAKLEAHWNEDSGSCEDSNKFITQDPIVSLDKYLSPVQEVVQSSAVKRAWARVLHYLQKFNVKDPYAYELHGSIYSETRDFVKLPEDDVQEFEQGIWEPTAAKDDTIFQMEPQEKLFGRFAVYEKALLYMIEHFETLRPLLSEIKAAYRDVIDKCEREAKDLDRLRLEQLKRKELYSTQVRQKDQEGDRELMEARLQIYVLQEHIQWQQHTLDIILGVLTKMRQSLRLQSRALQKTATKYRNKVEILAKEIVTQQAAAFMEISVGKHDEVLSKFKNVKDGRELRKMLNTARTQLRKVQRQIMVYEAEYDEY